MVDLKVFTVAQRLDLVSLFEFSPRHHEAASFYPSESWRHKVIAADPRQGARGYCGSDRVGGVGSWLCER